MIKYSQNFNEKFHHLSDGAEIKQYEKDSNNQIEIKQDSNTVDVASTRPKGQVYEIKGLSLSSSKD